MVAFRLAGLALSLDSSAVAAAFVVADAFDMWPESNGGLRVVFDRELDRFGAAFPADLPGQPEREVKSRRHARARDDVALVHDSLVGHRE